MEDIARRPGPFAKPPKIEIGQRILIKPRVSLLRGLIIATIGFSALASISAAVHTGKTPHFLLRATGPMSFLEIAAKITKGSCAAWLELF